MIIEEIEEGVHIFDKSKPTCLATDWTKTGIEFWFFQKHHHCPSTAAQVGKLHSLRAASHNPSRRSRNLKEKTLRYKFCMVHIPGVRHKAANAVSRHPPSPTNPDMMPLPDDIAGSGTSAIPTVFNPSGHSFLTGIRCREPPAVYTTSNDELASLVSSLATTSLHEYHQFRDHLYTVDGVILYKARTVIPPFLHQHILTILHSVHQGMTSMTACAETTIFWPGITPAITATWTNCHHRNRMAPSQPNAPPFPPVLRAYPFQCISADFFHYKGKNSLVMVDRYSNWPIIEQAQAGSKERLASQMSVRQMVAPSSPHQPHANS